MEWTDENNSLLKIPHITENGKYQVKVKVDIRPSEESMFILPKSKQDT